MALAPGAVADDTVQQVEATVEDDPSDPADPVGPTEPVGSAEPVEPADQADPTADPPDPDPTEAGDPSEPDDPTPSDDPTEPGPQPTDPQTSAPGTTDPSQTASPSDGGSPAQTSLGQAAGSGTASAQNAAAARSLGQTPFSAIVGRLSGDDATGAPFVVEMDQVGPQTTMTESIVSTPAQSVPFVPTFAEHPQSHEPSASTGVWVSDGAVWTVGAGIAVLGVGGAIWQDRRRRP
jgi:hypothetical protein